MLASVDAGSSSPEADPSTRVRCCTKCKAIYRTEYERCPTDGAAIEILDGDPLIGTTLGEHYVIDSMVGEGAMGRVYRAHHARLDRKMFAVKVLLGDLAATVQMRMRFAQEADAASTLDHPNVVSVFDFGRTDAGLLYLVMDFIEGRMLGDLIEKEGPQPASRVVALARQMCAGLAHAHDQGLVHRDFKPDNVILANGVPRILDFGLAIAANAGEGSARLTTAGVTVGTPIYAAPEQATGAASIDRRADLFALGVTLYEMLAGVPPFTGNIAEILFRNVTEPAPPIAERVPGVVVPPSLEAVVMRLMEKAPDDRYANAREVIMALDACDLHASALLPAAAALVEVRADELPPISQAMPAPQRRTPLVLGAIAIVAAAAVAGFVLTRSKNPPAPAVAMVQPDAGEAVGSLDAGLVALTAEDAAVAVVLPEPVDADTVAPRADAGATMATVDPVRPPRERPVDAGVRVDAAARVSVPPVDAATAIATRPPVDAAPLVRPPVDAAPVARPPVDAAPPAPLLTTAAVSFDGLDVSGGLSGVTVKRGLERALGDLRSCYRDAARAAGKSPPIRLKVSLVIDESGSAQKVSGAKAALPKLADCARAALRGVRTTAPDVGTVNVSLSIVFQPEAP